MLGVSLLLLWLGGAVLSKVAHSIQLEQIEEDVDKRTALFSTTLLDALLSEDIPVLETTLQGLIKIHPNLVGAEFCNYQNSPLLTWGEYPPHCVDKVQASSGMQGTLLTSQRPIIFEEERFGTVALRWDLQLPMKLLDQQIEQFVYLMVLAVLFLAMVLFITVRQLVVQPIHRVDQYLRGVQSGEVATESKQTFVSKELIHLCEGVDVLQQSMEAEAQLRDDLQALLASLEEKVAERTQALRQSNDRLTSIMEHMGDGLFVVDEYQQVTVFNPAASQLFPQLKEASAEQTFSDLFPDTVATQLDRLLATESHRMETLLFTGEEGEQISLALSSTPLQIREEARHHLLLVRDVTRQRELEEKEQLVAFQSGITEMSISIMHNIGNALAGISGQVLKVKNGKKALHNTVQILDQLVDNIDELPKETQVKAIRQLQSIVNKLLDNEIGVALEQLDKGVESVSEIIRLQRSNVKPIFQLSRFSPYAFLHDVALILAPQCERYEIEVKVHVDRELNEVYLPRNQLFQAMVNLVKNGIEAIAEQRPARGLIEITLTDEVVSGVSGLKFSVQDNGVGVATEQIGKVFNFGQTSKQSGSGVGLHVTANFANSFGGKVGLESTGVGEGATAWIWLPLQAENKRAPE